MSVGRNTYSLANRRGNGDQKQGNEWKRDSLDSLPVLGRRLLSQSCILALSYKYLKGQPASKSELSSAKHLRSVCQFR